MKCIFIYMDKTLADSEGKQFFLLVNWEGGSIDAIEYLCLSIIFGQQVVCGSLSFAKCGGVLLSAKIIACRSNGEATVAKAGIPRFKWFH